MKQHPQFKVGTRVRGVTGPLEVTGTVVESAPTVIVVAYEVMAYVVDGVRAQPMRQRMRLEGVGERNYGVVWRVEKA